MRFNNKQTDLKLLRKLFPCGTYLTISWHGNIYRTIGKVDRFVYGHGIKFANQLQYICQYGVDASDTFLTNYQFGINDNEVRLSTKSEIEFLERIREKEMLKNS